MNIVICRILWLLVTDNGVTQAWAACNLNTTKNPNGTLIGSSAVVCGDHTSYDNNFIYGCDDDDSSPPVDWTKNKGRLYTWAAAMNSHGSIGRRDVSPMGAQGICPDGYIIPSHYALKQLEKALGGTEAIDAADLTTGYKNSGVGTKLKTGGSSELDFIRYGRRKDTGEFDRNSFTYIWSSSENSSILSFGRYTRDTAEARVSHIKINKDYALSVRCLKL